jgi:ABC-type dipeptide/oligopeptide/nickel transport system ATPase subunit
MSKEIGPIKGAPPTAPAVVIVMGVSGCGKSTVGALLARHSNSGHRAALIKKVSVLHELTSVIGI